MDRPHEAVHLRKTFPHDEPDAKWIEELGRERNWVIVSADRRIMRNPHERRAWQASRLTAFFLEKGWAKQTLWHQASGLVRWWPHIMAQAERIEPGAGFLVPVGFTGRFKQVPHA